VIFDKKLRVLLFAMPPSEIKASVERSFELERIVFFSDAVYAIAITLLAIELRVPELGQEDTAGLYRALLAEWPRFLAFALSFWIIALFWIAHHRYFRYIKRYDYRLITLNFLILFFIALIPFTSSVLGEYGDSAGGIWLYAVNMLLLGLSDAWLWRHAATRHHLVDAALAPNIIRALELRALTTPLAALVVLALSFLIGGLASFGWFSILIFRRMIERRDSTNN